MVGARLIVTASVTDFEDAGGTAAGGGADKKGLLGGGLSSWDKEPKGRAFQEVIDGAVEYLIEAVPERYFTEAPV